MNFERNICNKKQKEKRKKEKSKKKKETKRKKKQKEKRKKKQKEKSKKKKEKSKKKKEKSKKKKAKRKKQKEKKKKRKEKKAKKKQKKSKKQRKNGRENLSQRNDIIFFSFFSALPDACFFSFYYHSRRIGDYYRRYKYRHKYECRYEYEYKYHRYHKQLQLSRIRLGQFAGRFHGIGATECKKYCILEECIGQIVRPNSASTDDRFKREYGYVDATNAGYGGCAEILRRR